MKMFATDQPVYQSAVNVSEGRRPEVIGAIISAASAVAGVVVADHSADVDHNRMVVTLLGDGRAIREAVLALAAVAVERVDLRSHQGAHPRIGAVDVIPVVPLRNADLRAADEVAHAIANGLAGLGVPSYLYEHSARVGRPIALPTLRKGGFEGLFTAPLTGPRAPDVGPSRAHASAGIAVVGARTPLVAYNINLPAEHETLARRAAALIRAQREIVPALTGVRALGLALPQARLAQISMNLTQPNDTDLPSVYHFAQELLAEFGVEPYESEVIGLIPARSMGKAAPADIRWREYRREQLVEYWLGEPLPAALAGGP